MRNSWIIFSWLVFTACCHYTKAQESTGRNLYSSRYDNLDIDAILSSNRLVTNYVECLLNKKPCPPEGKDLKRILPEALRTKCGRCSPRQKENALRIITMMYHKYPHHYKALIERWDPTGEYNRRFEQYLEDQQFNQIHKNDRPIKNDYDRDQSQVNVQKLPPNSPNALIPDDQKTPMTTTRSTTTQKRTPKTTESTTFRIETAMTTLRPVRSQSTESTTPETTQKPSTTTESTTFEIETQNFDGMRTTQPSKASTTEFSIVQRFGDADRKTDSTTKRFYTTRGVPSRTTTIRYTPPNNIIDNFFISPSISTYNNPSGSPIVGLFNHIGTKIHNTAGFIATMLRSTADVIIGHRYNN